MDQFSGKEKTFEDEKDETKHNTPSDQEVHSNNVFNLNRDHWRWCLGLAVAACTFRTDIPK